MEFQIGDKVEVLDEVIKGKVINVINNKITVEDVDGFLLEFDPSQLVKITTAIKVTNDEVAQIKSQKEIQKKKTVQIFKSKERNSPKMEVDLHIHQLINSTKGMTNFEMLNLQLETAKRQLEFAMRKHIQKIVFIHGVGEGVLKEELKYLFNRYENVKFYDADYQKYGLGANEVYIFQNP
ncbi:Smr/MutS family protein [Croceitalea rosinachiae]|uniref:DNA mismatch repair protein MutS n=1 Tax=Croceitalea rosinachiae TaxID=3075596 RepID=A0ABU3ABM5_9FLAO|nr:Smr/MutS family protein [Croceitalea sp. F388]MDT0606962.1 DNA mismatch repair protein MutS [Croceitalea sp. F388]